MNLPEEARPSIERLVLAISNSLRLEVAIFDSECNLFYGTPNYLKKKGRIVHAPSIQEVLSNGSILVNKPGKMASCIGCRFKDHCPSSAEILCCIRAGTMVVGVLDFTSFTKEGQRRINDDSATYFHAVTEFYTLLGQLILGHGDTRDVLADDQIIQSALEISLQPILLTDGQGVVTHYNEMAAKILQCAAAAASLWQIFPEEIARELVQGVPFFERSVPIGAFNVKITSRTLRTGGRPTAILVRFSGEVTEKLEPSGFFIGIIGDSPEIKNIQRLIKKLADSPTPVLITGETGTGKELIARSIHEQSKRKNYPFVAINCSSIPESLFESELFGYEEGTFTGGKKGGKMGKIEMAQGGTLFLDELGEMPLSIQPKLLRVLQEYELERLGSTSRIHLDIRVITATNCRLGEMMESGKFREDLFYRVGVINLKLPPLRERKSDILPISMNFFEKLKQKLHTPLTSVSPEVETLFLSYRWPGNIRELQNVIEYAANVCEGETMTLADLPDTLLCRSGELLRQPSAAVPDEVQIRTLLEEYGCTLAGKKRIAAALGISLRTLYRRLERLGL